MTVSLVDGAFIKNALFSLDLVPMQTMTNPDLWNSMVVLGDAMILSLNCVIRKTQYCNRTLVAETIVI